MYVSHEELHLNLMLKHLSILLSTSSDKFYADYPLFIKLTYSRIDIRSKKMNEMIGTKLGVEKHILTNFWIKLYYVVIEI